MGLLNVTLAADQKLNVLFLMSDDMRPELGCYGHAMASHKDFRTANRAIELLGKYQDRPFFLACGLTKACNYAAFFAACGQD